jgi:hypothetical protein
MSINAPMSQESIYQILFSALSTADSILQIWLTVTFAVLVVAFLAGKQVSKFMYMLVSTLYGLASIVLIIRFVSAAFLMFHFQSLLVENVFAPWPVPSRIGKIVGGGSFLLLFGGTAGTLWFIRSTREDAENHGAS